MISIFRNGPKVVIFESSSIGDLSDTIVKSLGALRVSVEAAFELADQDDTIVFITEPGKKEIHMDDIREALFLPVASDDFFSSIINLNQKCHIDHSRISPGLLIMRTVGNTEKIVKSVAQTYSGEIMPLDQCLNKGTSSQAIIGFTQKPINRRLSLKDMDSKYVLVDINVHKLRRKMQNQVLQFLNEGFENGNWNDVQIRIFDRYSKYMLHLERLMLVLNSLDIGLILGQSWSKDYPRFMMSVLVYQIRLFTLLDPTEIKRMLVGLEYLDDGTRIVDLDLMHNGSKISWAMALGKSERSKPRNELGTSCRPALLNELNPEEKDELFRLEEQIIKSRD